MGKVRVTITESNCRGGYHKIGETYLVEDICPPICHELWSGIYPALYVLLNGGDLDHGDTRVKEFDARCPDGGRVRVHVEVVE